MLMSASMPTHVYGVGVDDDTDTNTTIDVDVDTDGVANIDVNVDVQGDEPTDNNVCTYVCGKVGVCDDTKFDVDVGTGIFTCGDTNVKFGVGEGPVSMSMSTHMLVQVLVVDVRRTVSDIRIPTSKCSVYGVRSVTIDVIY